MTTTALLCCIEPTTPSCPLPSKRSITTTAWTCRKRQKMIVAAPTAAVLRHPLEPTASSCPTSTKRSTANRVLISRAPEKKSIGAPTSPVVPPAPLASKCAVEVPPGASTQLNGSIGDAASSQRPIYPIRSLRVPRSTRARRRSTKAAKPDARSSHQQQHIGGQADRDGDAPATDGAVGARKKTNATYGWAGVRVEGGDLFKVRTFLDYRVVRGVKEVFVEWVGGARTWEPLSVVRKTCASHTLNAVVAWAKAGKTEPLSVFKKAFKPKPAERKHGAGEGNRCGFFAIKAAFELLGKTWITDDVVKAFIDSAADRGHNYDKGLSWPELRLFVRYVNKSLGKGTQHPKLRKLKDNLRKNGEHGRNGVRQLVARRGVFIGVFWEGMIGHFVAIDARAAGEPVVHEEDGTFILERHTWMDTCTMLGLYQVDIA